MLDLDKVDLVLCEEMAEMFAQSARQGYDSESFVKTFMKSDIAEKMDKRFHFYQWAGRGYIYGCLLDNYAEEIKKTNKSDDEDILYWIGYVYRYWHYYTGENSKEIYKIAPYRTMRAVYMAYHTLSCEMAIDRLKEAYDSKKIANSF